MAQYGVANFAVIAQNERYVARSAPYPTDWMIGSIEGIDFSYREEARTALASMVLDSLVDIEPNQIGFSSCTDGRRRDSLLDGSQTVPVRQQAVGASALTGFRVAEALGKQFYGPDIEMLSQRLKYAYHFMGANGIAPSTHLNCGAAENFVTVLNNERQFAADFSYRRRLAVVMPANVYDADMLNTELDAIDQRLAVDMYGTYSADRIIGAVIGGYGGPQAVESLLDEGRGANRHAEAAIAVIDGALDGVALDINGLRSASGQQVFGVNNSLLERIAQAFSNGGQDEETYVKAWHAMASFGAAGHGTLGNSQETWLIANAA